MEDQKLKFALSHEWTFKTSTFGIQIRCWDLSGSWVWNMYALIYDNHPLFLEPERATDLDFHGGCTYDEKFTQEPARGIKYEWQKARSMLKIGCDYNHYCDTYFNQCGPEDGIPSSIQEDAQRLYRQLEEAQCSPTSSTGSSQ